MSPAGEVKRALYWYLVALAVLSAIAWAVVTGRPYPHNTFLFDPEWRFSDFTIFDERFQQFIRTGDFFGLKVDPFGYPAPVAFVYYFFYKYFRDPLVAYLATALAGVSAAALFFCARLRRTAAIPGLAIVTVAVTAALSYPFMYVYDRANMEALIWIIIAAAIAAFVFEKHWLAAFLIGIAAACKLFPGIFLLLFLTRRKYKELAFGVFTFAAIMLISMRCLSHSIAETAAHLAVGASLFRMWWILFLRPKEIAYDHSLFALIKQLLYIRLKFPALNQALEKIYYPYMATVAFGFFSSYVMYVRKLPLLNQFFIFTIVAIWLPFVSYDYTLIHLYLPWAAFLVFLTSDVARGKIAFSMGQALAFLIPLAVLFTPQTYLLLTPIVGFGGQIKSVALIALLYAAFKHPMPSGVFGDLRHRPVGG